MKRTVLVVTAAMTVVAAMALAMAPEDKTNKVQGLTPEQSFVIIPHGVPHFVAATDGAAIVQLSGVGTFRTDFVEK